MSSFIGIDTGGTFTDCVVVDREGRVISAKALTTYHDLSQGILEAAAKAAGGLGLSVNGLLKRTTLFCQFSTIDTNTLLTRSGDKTALLTTSFAVEPGQ